MNHQLFKEWLLSEEHLSVEQTQALQDHIHSCESCRQIESAWKELEPVLQKSPQAGPTSGFTERWQTYLVQSQAHQQERRGWLTIGVAMLIFASLLVVSVTQLWSLIQAPDLYLAAWLNRLVGVISVYYILQNIVSSFSWSIPVYTFVGMFFLVGFISFMSVLWLTAYRKFSLVRRVI
jgi:hypothetical protein